MKWIKASERLPPHPDSPEYHYRVDGEFKVNGNFYHDQDGDLMFSIQGTANFDGYNVPSDNFSQLEWLDESEPSFTLSEMITAINANMQAKPYIKQTFGIDIPCQRPEVYPKAINQLFDKSENY